ncbi:pyrrolo-quinoline quinone, partial [bacterium SM23_31]
MKVFNFSLIFLLFLNFLLYSQTPGTKKWEFQADHDVYSSPAIGSDGTVYVGAIDCKLYALNSNGTKKWEFQTGSSVRSSPAIGTDGTVYVGADDDKLYAINP